MPSSGSDLDQPATFKTSNASLPLDLYKAPYEKRTSSTNLSVVDNVTKELSNLGMSDVRHRRDTFPVRHICSQPILNFTYMLVAHQSAS